MDTVCKKCGHSCHCKEGNHEECQCENCECKSQQPINEGVVIDDTNECEWCQ
jgi:hypothetical protein